MAWQAPVAQLVLLVLVAGCGGDRSTGAEPVSAPDGLIRFAGTLTDNSLTISPLPGADSIASRPIASVQLRVDDGAAQLLNQPTGTNAAGQAVYAFAVPARPPTAVPAPPCGAYRSYEITVTDMGGFSYTKYQSGYSCASFTGLSDYGAGMAQFRLAATGGTFGFSFARDGAAGYSDVGYAAVAGDRVWSLPAREGDALYLSGAFTDDAGEGAQATLSIESGGTALASLAADRTRGGSLMVACCRGAAPAAVRHAVAFAVRPQDMADGDVPDDPDFAVAWRVVRGGTGEIVRSFSGTGAGETSWSVDADEGDRLQLDIMVTDVVAVFAMITADGRQLANMMGYAPGPMRLDVACCVPPRQ